MAVKIRLKRMGAMKRPFYRLVVADSRSPRDGRFIEILGYYNPCVEPVELKIDGEKAKLWLSRGAQPTDTASALLKKEGLIARSVPKPVRAADPKKTATAKAE
jgi:small subunit ribosomal protein S16